MPFFDKLQDIERLQSAIEQHGKITPDVLRKINYKFRLDWNYYSNMIEGNSLTMQETRSIMIGNVTVDGKPIKDVMEMKGHDDVISDILKIGKSELNLSEKRIKDIHKAIMHEEDIAKQPSIGQWKSESNYLYNYKKERFDFTPPADVTEAMHKLMNWLNTEKEKISRKAKGALHPIQLAFHFHIDYVTIHPFYDGNGRTARIFTNLILISYGYPPVYVKDTEKETYNQYLGEIQTYGGDTELFYEFMGGLLIRSQQLVLDAIEGKEIDEVNDWQKKLHLLKIEKNEDDLKFIKNDQSVKEVVNNSIRPLLTKLLNDLQGFEELFSQKNLIVYTQSRQNPYQFNANDKVDWAIDFFLQSSVDDGSLNRIYDEYHPIHELFFKYSLSGYKRDGTNTFSVSLNLKWRFDEYKYVFFNNQEREDQAVSKLYHVFYTQVEAEDFINTYANELIKNINNSIQK